MRLSMRWATAGFHPDAGQAHDLQGSDALLPDMAAETLLADKAFDADERVIEPLLAQGEVGRGSRPRATARFNAIR